MRRNQGEGFAINVSYPRVTRQASGTIQEYRIGALVPGNNILHRVWVVNEDGVEINQAVPGQKITVMADVTTENLAGASIGNSYKAVITAIEPDQPIASAWKNGQEWNPDVATGRWREMKLNEYPNGSQSMPNRDLNLRVRLFLRDDTDQPWPPIDMW